MTKNRLLLIAVISITAVAFGDTHYFAVQEGNEKYRKGEYEEALKNYRRAQIEKDSGVSRYNLGNAYFRKKEYGKAAELFSGVFSGANESENAELASKSLYNYGNSKLAAGDEKASRENLPGAIDDLKAAAGAYKITLLQNPANTNAKHNMELALNKLSELEKKQQQQQSNEQENKDEENKEKENKEDNKNSQKDKNEISESKKDNEQEKQTKMKPEDVKRILEALAQNEKKVLKELRAKKMRERRLEKDW
ncbi:MAG: tetratricopeptide repeat protein, partial [Nitrospinota bacterium]